MTNYREILRLRSLGINHSQIAESMGTIVIGGVDFMRKRKGISEEA